MKRQTISTLTVAGLLCMLVLLCFTSPLMPQTINHWVTPDGYLHHTEDRDMKKEYGENLDYQAAIDELNEAKVAQDDPRLIKLIRDFYIEPPSGLPYNLKIPDRKDYSKGQAPFIDSRLNYMLHVKIRELLPSDDQILAFCLKILHAQNIKWISDEKADQEEMKSVQKKLKEESEKLIPDDFTPEIVTRIIIDLALSRNIGQDNSVGSGRPSISPEQKEATKGATKQTKNMKKGLEKPSKVTQKAKSSSKQLEEGDRNDETSAKMPTKKI